MGSLRKQCDRIECTFVCNAPNSSSPAFLRKTVPGECLKGTGGIGVDLGTLMHFDFHVRFKNTTSSEQTCAVHPVFIET